MSKHDRFETMGNSLALLKDFLCQMAKPLREGIRCAHVAQGVSREDFARDLALPLAAGSLRRPRLVSLLVREAQDPYEQMDLPALLRYLIHGGSRLLPAEGEQAEYAGDQDLFYRFFGIELRYSTPRYEPWRRKADGAYTQALAELMCLRNDLTFHKMEEQSLWVMERIPEGFACMIRVLSPLCGVQWEHRDKCEDMLQQLQQAKQQSLLELGRYLRRSPKADWDRALNIYRELAEQNYPQALQELAECYSCGHGVRADQKKANALLQQAAELGCVDAMVELAAHYKIGLGTQEDLSRAFGLYATAAAAGSAEAMYALGRCYRDGEGVDSDPQQAVYWFTRAVELDSREAMLALGMCCAEGFGTAESPAAAEDWFLRAEQEGMSVAKSLRMAMALTPADAAGDPVQLHWMTDHLWQMVNSESSLGMRLLADCYRQGIGVEQDIETALGLLRMAVEHGSAPAMRTLGQWYAYGWGVEKDLLQAESWYEIATQHGDTTSMRLLAELYLHSSGGEIDPDRALQLYEKAAGLDDAEAAYLLGRHYLFGTLPCEPGAPARREAVYWLGRAARLGHAQARQELEALDG